MALRGGMLDIGPQEVVPDRFKGMDPRAVQLARQTGLWHPGIEYPRGSKQWAHEQEQWQQIMEYLGRQDALVEQRNLRRDLQSERLQERRDTQAAIQEDRGARTRAYQESGQTRRMEALQLLISDPNVPKETKASATAELAKIVGASGGGTTPTVAPTGGPKGEYGPEDKAVAGGAPAGAGGGQPAYTPPTAAFAPGLEYFGPVDRSGRPASASSGPWTVRAAGPDGATPLPPQAFARAFGHTTAEGLQRGLATAMTTDVLRQPIPPGESGVEALADIGGAGAQRAVGALMRAEPGATIAYPEVYGPKGGHVSNASTYLPQPNEVFRPSAKTSKGGRERIGDVLGPPGYDPGIDPRYAAEILRSINPEVAKQYEQIAAAHSFETVPGTPAEQQAGRMEHTFMRPPVPQTAGGFANVPPGEQMIPGEAGQGYKPPTAAFAPPAAKPSELPEPPLGPGSTVTGRGEFRGVYPQEPNTQGRLLDLPTKPPPYVAEAERLRIIAQQQEQERLRRLLAEETRKRQVQTR